MIVRTESWAYIGKRLGDLGGQWRIVVEVQHGIIHILTGSLAGYQGTYLGTQATPYRRVSSPRLLKRSTATISSLRSFGGCSIPNIAMRLCHFLQ